MLFALPEKGKYRRRVIAILPRQPVEGNRPAIDARRRAGFQTPDAKRQGVKFRRQIIRCRIAGPTAGVVFKADMNAPGQKGTAGQHHGGCAKGQAHLRDHANHPRLLDQQIRHRLLKQTQTGLIFQFLPDKLFVERTIGLGAGGAHRRPLAGVEYTKLNPGMIDSLGHDPTQSVDFLDQMAFADAADGRIAAHLSQGVDVLRQ